MVGRVSSLEASALEYILTETLDQLSVLHATLIPKTNAQHCDCPGMRLPAKELNVRKTVSFSSHLGDTIKSTILALSQQSSFSPLADAVDKLEKDEKFRENINEEEEVLPEKLKTLHKEVKLVSSQLEELQDPRLVCVSLELMKKDELKIEEVCADKIRYFDKYFDEKKEDCLRHLGAVEQDIRNEMEKMQRNIEQEERCTHEMQSFLHTVKEELLSEQEHCMALQDELMAEKETKMQVLRIRKEHLEEETAKDKDKLIQRADEMEQFQQVKEARDTEMKAVGVVQTWWREMIAARPKLLEFVRKKSKAKKKKKKKEKE